MFGFASHRLTSHVSRFTCDEVFVQRATCNVQLDTGGVE
jgi:hypothetical protein